MVEPVRLADLVEALGLLLGRAVGDEEQRAGAFQELVRNPRRRRDILVAYDGSRIIGAVYAQALAGASAVVWPPQTRFTDAALADALMVAAIEHVQPCRVIQAFLEPSQETSAAALERAGFQRVTDVTQLVWHGPAPSGPPSPIVALRPATECEWAEVVALVVRCHDDSLDCPELNGQRTTEEMLAGYRDIAPDLTRWFVAECEHQRVGIAIMADDELCFLGVVPDGRQRGIGRAILQALGQTSAKIALIVDVRNQPALKLYQSFGFVQSASRAVFLKLQ